MGQQTEITAKLDTESLVEAWAKKKGMKPRYLPDLRLGARTDLGLARENNEDKFEFFQPEEPEVLAIKGYFYAVADGMGGHASGQIASEIALKTIVKSYYADPDEDTPRCLRDAYRTGNGFIHDTANAIAERHGMGTTCTTLVIKDDDMYLAHVGDSRLYLVRGGEIRQISQDHSWVAEQVRRGALTEEEARMSPFRNVITRSMGTAPDVEVDIATEKIVKDDVFILCSDGLSGYVSDEEILDIADNSSPAMAALKLIDRANEHGGGDNITAVVVAVRDLQKANGGSPLQRLLGRA
jgi:serine/threonine protein phosphatase PrpC